MSTSSKYGSNVFRVGGGWLSGTYMQFMYIHIVHYFCTRLTFTEKVLPTDSWVGLVRIDSF